MRKLKGGGRSAIESALISPAPGRGRIACSLKLIDNSAELHRSGPHLHAIGPARAKSAKPSNGPWPPIE